MMTGLAVSDLTFDVPRRRLFEGLTFDVPPGCATAIVGPSGSGKTSLLHCLAGISLPTAGSITLGHTELSGLSMWQRSAFRLANIGMVFQFGELLPELTVVENVALPLRLRGVNRRDAERRARECLRDLLPDDRDSDHPDSLSGGEVQRVGIARAFVNHPALILADEPTGALDEDNALNVARVLLDAAHRHDVSVVVATHNALLARMADQVIHMGKAGSRPEAAAVTSPAS
jgi:putative ABC transport system ATP-binding protein